MEGNVDDGALSATTSVLLMAMGEQCAAAPTSDCLMPTTFLLSVTHTHTPSPPGLE